MDMKAYYEKVREIEATLPSPFAVIASLETPGGGKAGVLIEAETGVAALLIMDGKARAATAEEVQRFRGVEAPAAGKPKKG